MELQSLKWFFCCSIIIAMANAAAVRRLQSDLVHTLGRPYYIAYACERTMLKISCRDGDIAITHATYGRQNMRHCVNDQLVDTHLWSVRCATSASRTTRTVASMCNGKKTCSLPVANAIFGDPCRETYKYLEIYYACLDL